MESQSQARLAVERMFRYKKNPRWTTWDVEALPHLFSFVALSETLLTVVTYADHSSVPVPGVHEIRAMAGRWLTLHDLDRKVIVHRLDSASLDDANILKDVLDDIVLCDPLPGEKPGFMHYGGWNSSDYDLPLICAIVIALQQMRKDGNQHIAIPTTADIRALSDTIITFDGRIGQVGGVLEETNPQVTKELFSARLRIALHQDGHVDWARLAKLTDERGDMAYPPGLKREMAKQGMDIVEDSLVAGDTRELSEKDILDFLSYNINDVYGTDILSHNRKLRGLLDTRDIVRELYPHTSARKSSISNLKSPMPLERDCTAASLVGSVLIGENRKKPRDNESIQYLFPVPDPARPGKTLKVDLLDFILEHEAYVPQPFIDFFSHFRGKDVRSRHNEFEVARTQPTTGKPTCNIPYYREGKPTDAYIRVSMGGAHGSLMAGLSAMTPEAVSAWIASDKGAVGREKPTVDLAEVVHADWESFYPVMAKKLEMYLTEEGLDRYTDIIERRFAIKHSLPHNKAEWTVDDKYNNSVQTGLKFVLNNATGAGNTHSKYALLPIDNKTTSMRLIGNMNIWCLAQRLTQAGALIVSTNTDGIYFTGVSLEKARKVIGDYVALYGMNVDPEIVPRFINRDTSNRIELDDKNRIMSIGGRLRHGAHLTFSEDAIGMNVPYPLAVGHSVIRYMVDNTTWLTDLYDRERMYSIMRDCVAQAHNVLPFCHVHVGSSATRLTVDGKTGTKINRVVLTHDGKHLGVRRRAVFRVDEIRAIMRAGEDWLTYAHSNGLELAVDVPEGAIPVLADKQDAPGVRGKVAVPIADQPDQNILDSNDTWADYRKKHGSLTIVIAKPGHTQGTDKDIPEHEKWLEVKVWRDGELTGYPSDTGVVVNTAEGLAAFDMTRLDIDAYVRWAEDLLSTWKVTGTIPELGLSAHDDTVGDAQKAHPRGGAPSTLTKEQQWQAQIRWLYEASWTDPNGGGDEGAQDAA